MSHDHDDLHLIDDRFFTQEPKQRALCGYLLNRIITLPLICSPCTSSAAQLFPPHPAATPTDWMLTRRPEILQHLYAHRVLSAGQLQQEDPRAVWQLFAENFFLLRGTPAAAWLTDELYTVFGVRHKLSARTAQEAYETIEAALANPDFTAPRLLDPLHIETLCTSETAVDALDFVRDARIRPAFCPDALFNLQSPDWKNQVDRLSQASGIDCAAYAGFCQALENRRAFFRQAGSTAVSITTPFAFTTQLSASEAGRIFQQALQGNLTPAEAALLQGHLLLETARQSSVDGLPVHWRIASGSQKLDLTNNLRPLLDALGHHPTLKIILSTAAPTADQLELAPLAAEYPALLLGSPLPPHNGPQALRQHFRLVAEQTGPYKLAGLTASAGVITALPAQHEIYRRLAVDWIAELIVQGRLDLEDAEELVCDLVYYLPRHIYQSA